LKDVVKRPLAFKKDMAKFYGVNPSMTKDVDLQKFTTKDSDK
jgi:phage portal protein BeeE